MRQRMIKEFVKAASKCDFDVDISYNRILIDAKSILGILSMDLTRVLTVTCHGEDHEFDRFLRNMQLPDRQCRDRQDMKDIKRKGRRDCRNRRSV